MVKIYIRFYFRDLWKERVWFKGVYWLNKMLVCEEKDEFFFFGVRKDMGFCVVRVFFEGIILIVIGF